MGMGVVYRNMSTIGGDILQRLPRYGYLVGQEAVTND